MCVQQLAGIAQRGESEGARVSAIGMLLDRGWGRAEQLHTGTIDGEITIVIRTDLEHHVENPKLINGKAKRINGGSHGD